MADEFDPCECINLMNHEGRMQRLISMLQNSQSSCTDSECFTDGTGLATPGAAAPESQFAMWTFIIGWIVMAVVLYFMSPSKSGGKPKSSSHRDDRDNGGRDPAPVF